MNLLYVFLVAVLVTVFGVYVILAVYTSKDTTAFLEGVMNSPIPLTLPQQEEFTRSMQRSQKSALFWQGVLMAIATIAFVVFNWKPFVFAAMFCACFAAWHFYQAKQIVV